MDASATPADNLIQIFNVKPEDVKIMALSHRVPRTHAAKLNKIILEHPDECLDATNNVAHVEVPDTAVDGILTENAIEEEHPLPPTIEMEGKTREETRAHTVGILTRNQKNVDELKAVMMGSGEDVGVRTLGGVETTRRVMLDQLRYFENKNIVTMQSMKTYLHAHSSEKAHKYKRNALETQLDAFAQFRGNDLDMFANIMSSMRAWITAKFAVWPSKQLSTIHAVKGEEFKRVDLHHMNLIPSTRSESRKDEFPALYAAEIHLLLVALSRSYCELNIFETPDERKLRLEQKHMVAVPEGQSSSSQLSDTLEAIATVADNSANEASAERTALNIMGLTESPTTMRDFKEYVSTKRMLLDPNEVEAFMVASNVIKRQLLSFQPSAPTCSICLSELGHNGDVMSLMCAHSFCTPCITHYVDHCITTHLNPACPNCKRALTPQEVASMQEDSD